MHVPHHPLCSVTHGLGPGWNALTNPGQTQSLDAVCPPSILLCSMGREPDADTLMLHLAETLQICPSPIETPVIQYNFILHCLYVGNVPFRVQSRHPFRIQPDTDPSVYILVIPSLNLVFKSTQQTQTSQTPVTHPAHLRLPSTPHVYITCVLSCPGSS